MTKLSYAPAFVVLCGVAFAGQVRAEVPRHGPNVAIRPIGADVPALSGAAVRATLAALTPDGEEAEFRVGCGWYYHPKRRVKLGLWRVSLRGVAFTFETYPNGPASGINHTESRKTWEVQAFIHGWSGTLYFPPGEQPFLTDGPTTDICGGVLG